MFQKQIPNAPVLGVARWVWYDSLTLRAIAFFGLVTSAFASATLDVLVNAAASFSTAIQQQLEMLQSNPAPAELAEKMIGYAEAKAAWI
jgi:hypothetical protein